MEAIRWTVYPNRLPVEAAEVGAMLKDFILRIDLGLELQMMLKLRSWVDVVRGLSIAAFKSLLTKYDVLRYFNNNDIIDKWLILTCQMFLRWRTI
jgi:hypothetical protein